MSLKRTDSFFLRVYAVLCTLMCGAPLYAQKSYVKDGGDFSGATTGLGKVLTSMIGFVSVLMALGAMVSLVSLVINLMKGDQNGARRLAWWVGGLAVGFVLLTVIKNVFHA